MRTLVYGGAACGKSELAEGICHTWAQRRLRPAPGSSPAPGAPRAPLVYLATMEPTGAEDRARIERHRWRRANAGFQTLERARDLAGLAVPSGSCVLVECLGTLVANELYLPPTYELRPADEACAAVLRGIAHLEERAEELVVVSNDVFADGVAYPAETRAYLDVLARVNAALAARFERVVEVVFGIGIWQKGGPA